MLMLKAKIDSFILINFLQCKSSNVEILFLPLKYEKKTLIILECFYQSFRNFQYLPDSLIGKTPEKVQRILSIYSTWDI